jgi:hypothetical protein
MVNDDAHGQTVVAAHLLLHFDSFRLFGGKLRVTGGTTVGDTGPVRNCFGSRQWSNTDGS